MNIQPGQLNKRITIQYVTGTSINANGVETETWGDYCHPWAAVSDVSGREYFAAAAAQMENVTKFIIRWYADITTAMRIVFEGRIYSIDAIDHAGYKGDYMVLRARLTGQEAAQ